MSPSAPKSGAIQALRALAITAVFIFHLNPKWLPNGYLGVDMFFVISGFLMTMILSKSRVTVTSIQTFFSRRIKRIVPLYLITIFCVLSCGRMILMSKDIRILSTDSLWSLGLVSNMQSIFHTYDYFEELTAYKLLTHTWSLSVELQYYLFVPFIMFFMLRMSSSMRIGIGLTIAVCSWILKQSIPPSISFGFLPCRVWQFFVGLLVFEISSIDFSSSSNAQKYDILHNIDYKAEKMTNKGLNSQSVVKEDSIYHMFAVIFFVAAIVCCVNITGIPEIDRLLATLITAVVIFCSTKGPTPLLDVRPLQYIGDISYVFYLAHWPVITFLKYNDDETDISNKNVLLAVLITSVVSVVVHHFVEQLFIKGDFRFALFWILVCYAACTVVLLIPSEDTGYLVGHQPGNSTKDCIQLSQNYEWPQLEFYKETAKGSGKYGELNGNGRADIVLLGNSFLRGGFPWFHKAFAGRYRRMYVNAFTTCLPFIDHTQLKDNVPWPCDDTMKRDLELMEKVKPKILMLSLGYRKGFQAEPFVNGENDRFARQAIKYLEIYSNLTEFILLDTPLMEISDILASKLWKRVEKQLVIPAKNETRFSYKAFLRHTQNTQRRLEVIKRNCPKCHFVDVQSEFCDGEYCESFDYDCNQPLYMTDGYHLSPFGYNRVYHSYKAAIDNVLMLAGEYNVDI